VVGGREGEEQHEELHAAPVLRSQLTCAVLGLVIEKPSHGYEIGQRFESRFGGFLRAGRSSIYSTLKGLVEAGLIEQLSVRSPTAARRGPKAGASYRATARGARAYRGWLAERLRSDPQRVEMLGRMTLAGVHSVEAALDFVDRYEQECVGDAKSLVGVPSCAGSGSDGVAGVVERLLVEERRRMIDAQLAWITFARAELRAVREQAPGGEAHL
jgi:DNA-binding PadR family transcriptional regulator